MNELGSVVLLKSARIDRMTLFISSSLRTPQLSSGLLIIFVSKLRVVHPQRLDQDGVRDCISISKVIWLRFSLLRLYDKSITRQIFGHMTCRSNDLVCCCVRFVSVLYFLMKSYTKRTHILVNHYPECFLELGMSVLCEKNKSPIMTKEPACVYEERRE